MSEAEVERSESQDTAECEAGPVKKLLPPGRLIMLSAVLFYVGYSYGVNEGYGIPLLLEAGLEERYAPFVFGISSIINVILGGYLGSSSDRCTSSLGRRRPYIIVLTIILLIATVLYPCDEDLSDAFQLENNARTVYLIAHTGVCVLIFDITLDMIHSLGRSYLFDSVSVQQASSGNAACSFMISAGSFFGALLSAVDWQDVLHLSSGSQTKVVFATAVIITSVCAVVTLSSVKEPKIGIDGKIDMTEYNSTWSKRFLCCNYCAFDLYDTHDYSNTNTSIQNKDTSKTNTSIQNKDTSQADETEPLLDKTPQQSKNHNNPCKFPCYLFMKAYATIQGTLYFVKSLSNTMLWLWLAQVLQWTTMLSLLFLITNYVAIFIYDGEPDADDDSEEKEDYDEGVRMGLYCKCVGFASSICFSAFLYSKYSQRFYNRAFHISIHILTFLSTGTLIFSKNIYVVASLHIIFGIYYSWILIIPLTLLQSYKVSWILLNWLATYFMCVTIGFDMK